MKNRKIAQAERKRLCLLKLLIATIPAAAFLGIMAGMEGNSEKYILVLLTATSSELIIGLAYLQTKKDIQRLHRLHDV